MGVEGSYVGGDCFASVSRLKLTDLVVVSIGNKQIKGFSVVTTTWVMCFSDIFYAVFMRGYN